MPVNWWGYVGYGSAVTAGQARWSAEAAVGRLFRIVVDIRVRRACVTVLGVVAIARVSDSGFQRDIAPSDRVVNLAVRRFSISSSHRRVGGGGCKALSRMAYAFGMVMYCVCAGWSAVG